GRCHIAGVAPRDLEQVALPPHRIVEVRQVPVVNGEHELVGLALAVLVHKRQHLGREVHTRAGAALRLHLDEDARLGARLNGHGAVSCRRVSAKISSLTTRTDGTNTMRPGSSASVGSWTGSGWKSAITHQRPAARGTGAKYRPARENSESHSWTTCWRVSGSTRNRKGSRSARNSRPRSSRTAGLNVNRENRRGGITDLPARHPTAGCRWRARLRREAARRESPRGRAWR